jgi:hypothetical protein
MSRLIALLVLAALASPCVGEEAPLGRLFLSPEQRVVLDNARRNRIRAEALAAAADKKPKIPPARSVTINGIVSRSDGESIVWVNGQPTEGETEDGLRVTVSPGSQSSIVVREPEKGRKVRLKVGQRADLLTGRIEESYERKAEAPRPAASAPETTPLPAEDTKTEGEPRPAPKEQHADTAAPHQQRTPGKESP